RRRAVREAGRISQYWWAVDKEGGTAGSQPGARGDGTFMGAYYAKPGAAAGRPTMRQSPAGPCRVRRGWQSPMEKVRISKLMAERGLWSRREADSTLGGRRARGDGVA